jgi:hypothetical protein
MAQNTGDFLVWHLRVGLGEQHERLSSYKIAGEQEENIGTGGYISAFWEVSIVITRHHEFRPMYC